MKRNSEHHNQQHRTKQTIHISLARQWRPGILQVVNFLVVPDTPLSGTAAP